MDNAIFYVIGILKQEIKTQGDSPGGDALLKKLEGWRKELEPIMVEQNAKRLLGSKDNADIDPSAYFSLTTQDGGMFTE